MIVQDWEWEGIRTWLLGLGWAEEDIDLVKTHREGIPLYTDQQSAKAIVDRLDDCALRYGVSWSLSPDLEMLITAGLTERALESLRINQLVQKTIERYLREVLLPKRAQEEHSSRQSKAGSKPREERAAKSNKPFIEAAVQEELPNWSCNSASKLAQRLGVSSQYIRRIQRDLRSRRREYFLPVNDPLQTQE